MPHVYDNWEKLVAAVVQRERNRKLCYSESLSSSFDSDDDSFASTSSRRFSFDHSSSDQLNEQAPLGGNSPSFATTSSANGSLFSHVPKPPKFPSSSRFDKIFGAARRFVTPVRKRPESRITNLPQDINAPEIQSGYSSPTELEVEREIPTVDAYALPFNELNEQTYNFGQQAIIAEGFYAKVYFARLMSGKDVALKILDASSESDSNDKFLKKVSTVSRFKHENVVEFLGYCIKNDRRILAYEFATMGTLHNFLHGRKEVTGVQTGPVLDWMQRVRIAIDAARGLEYLHENGTIHKDIRSSNVLLFNDFKTKIADINLSTKDCDDEPEGDPFEWLVETRNSPYRSEYRAEFGLSEEWTQKNDVYSFGVVLLELLTGRKCIDETLPEGQQNLVTWAKPQLTKNEVRGCVDPKLMGEYPPKAAAKLAAVASQCVQYEPALRPHMSTVVDALQLLLEPPAPGIDAYALSFYELKKQTYNYGHQAVIAKSFYGKVYFAWLKTGKGVALKMLDASSESDSNDEFLTKVSVVSRFKHENVVEFLGHHIENDQRILAYEFATMGTLHDALHDTSLYRGRKSTVTGRQVLDWRQRVRIAVDAARGLEYLHENAAIHKDIKSGNVLLFDDFKAKIADINLSTKDFHGYLSPDPEFHYSITARHPNFESHPPGFTMLGHLTQESDVYNFGVVLLELLTGKSSNTISRGPRRYQAFVTWAKPRLSKDRVEGYVDRKLMGNYPPEAAAKFADVAAQCLQDEAERRPDMRTVVKALQSLLEAPAPVIDACALPFNALKEQTFNFGPRAITAQGYYGSVYFARLRRWKDVALKMLDASSESDSNYEFLTKVSTASRFKHENLVEFLGYSIESNHRILAYEFATMGTLHDALHGKKIGPVLDWMQRVRIAVEAARGLEYLHENAVIHRDIRSSNVLLFKDFKAKIADINLSTNDPDDPGDDYLSPDPLYYTIIPGRPGYEDNAREFSLIGKWMQKTDVYNFGVVLLELLTGRKSHDKTLVPWATPNLSDDKVKHYVDPKLKRNYPQKSAAKLAQVAALCVQYEAKHRPDMRTVVKDLQLTVDYCEALELRYMERVRERERERERELE